MCDTQSIFFISRWTITPVFFAAHFPAICVNLWHEITRRLLFWRSGKNNCNYSRTCCIFFGMKIYHAPLKRCAKLCDNERGKSRPFWTSVLLNLLRFLKFFSRLLVLVSANQVCSIHQERKFWGYWAKLDQRWYIFTFTGHSTTSLIILHNWSHYWKWIWSLVWLDDCRFFIAAPPWSL